jgi:hypothetical protein
MSNTDSKDIRDYYFLYPNAMWFIKCYYDDWVYYDNRSCFHGNNSSIEEQKICLRPLSDMTEEELEYILDIGEHQSRIYGVEEFIAGWKAFGSETFRYLLSKHFDLFGLIESGLAIDKTKINHP